MLDNDKKLFKKLGNVLTELDIYIVHCENEAFKQKADNLYTDITWLRRQLLEQ